jgi:hypothetical protein
MRTLVEFLPTKCEALSSNPSSVKNLNSWPFLVFMVKEIRI